jgi:hypothetical protein
VTRGSSDIQDSRSRPTFLPQKKSRNSLKNNSLVVGKLEGAEVKGTLIKGL